MADCRGHQPYMLMCLVSPCELYLCDINSGSCLPAFGSVGKGDGSHMDPGSGVQSPAWEHHLHSTPGLYVCIYINDM